MKAKVLLVSGDGDFSVIEFENAHGGAKVKDIIADLDKYASEDEEWNLEVKEFEGPIDPAFAKFIKSQIQDYDQSKNINFFLESDTIGE